MSCLVPCFFSQMLVGKASQRQISNGPEDDIDRIEASQRKETRKFRYKKNPTHQSRMAPLNLLDQDALEPLLVSIPFLLTSSNKNESFFPRGNSTENSYCNTSWNDFTDALLYPERSGLERTRLIRGPQEEETVKVVAAEKNQEQEEAAFEVVVQEKRGSGAFSTVVQPQNTNSTSGSRNDNLVEDNNTKSTRKPRLPPTLIQNLYSETIELVRTATPTDPSRKVPESKPRQDMDEKVFVQNQKRPAVETHSPSKSRASVSIVNGLSHASTKGSPNARGHRKTLSQSSKRTPPRSPKKKMGQVVVVNSDQSFSTKRSGLFGFGSRRKRSSDLSSTQTDSDQETDESIAPVSSIAFVMGTDSLPKMPTFLGDEKEIDPPKPQIMRLGTLEFEESIQSSLDHLDALSFSEGHSLLDDDDVEEKEQEEMREHENAFTLDQADRDAEEYSLSTRNYHSRFPSFATHKITSPPNGFCHVSSMDGGDMTRRKQQRACGPDDVSSHYDLIDGKDYQACHVPFSGLDTNMKKYNQARQAHKTSSSRYVSSLYRREGEDSEDDESGELGTEEGQDVFSPNFTSSFQMDDLFETAGRHDRRLRMRSGGLDSIAISAPVDPLRYIKPSHG